MNIFKILANGDGSINEPNVSAFLGYLLDPYEDHGLGYEFLERVLDLIMNKFINEERNKFKARMYEYEILFEQAFRDDSKEDKKKEIVDIIILCFKRNLNKKETIVESIISETRQLEHIVLIENKIKIGSKTKHQLERQYENTKIVLDKILQDKSRTNIHSIYITPDDKSFSEEFNSFNNQEMKTHFIWKGKTEIDYDETNEIYTILTNIVSDESNAKIEAINEYTKHTLISFIKFIENDFKSQFIEKIENTEGKYKKVLHFNLESFLTTNKDKLSIGSVNLIKEFKNFINETYPNLFIRHSKTHPLSILTREQSGKIFSLTAYGQNLHFHFIFKHLNDASLKDRFSKHCDNLGYMNKPNDWGIIVFSNLEIHDIKILFNSYIDLLNQVS